MKILFRVDASSVIGTGHVFRCMSLGEELLGRGHTVAFACRAEPGHLIDLIRARGYQVYALSRSTGAISGELDAAEVIAATPAGYDWCIVDHYGLDAVFERAVSRAVKRIMTIDDLANRPHACDILLDTSHAAESADVYAGLVEPRTRLLIGQDYVLLRAAFRSLQPAPALGDVRRLLVTFGGNDPPGMTLRAVNVLKDASFSNLHIDVTSSIANPRLEFLRRAVDGYDRFAFHVDTPQFHLLLRDCDLCLGAGGTTTWERFYLGKPSIVVTLADNQFRFSQWLEARRLIRLLGFAPEITDDALARELHIVIGDRRWRNDAAHNGMALVDGRGVVRVAVELEAS